jgi:hypothetical protein
VGGSGHRGVFGLLLRRLKPLAKESAAHNAGGLFLVPMLRRPDGVARQRCLYSIDWPLALALAQRALAAMASLALVASLTFRFALTAFSFFAALRGRPGPLDLAQRLRWAAPMAARAAADIFRRRRLGAAPGSSSAGASAPVIEASCAFNASIFSLMTTTLRSCLTLRFCKFDI